LPSTRRSERDHQVGDDDCGTGPDDARLTEYSRTLIFVVVPVLVIVYVCSARCMLAWPYRWVFPDGPGKLTYVGAPRWRAGCRSVSPARPHTALI